MSASFPKVRVDQDSIRQLFEEYRFIERMRSGEFRWRYKDNYHPENKYENRPSCTCSHTIEWLDESGTRVALIHRLYHRTSRTHPDPKQIVVDETIYYTGPTPMNRSRQ